MRYQTALRPDEAGILTRKYHQSAPIAGAECSFPKTKNRAVIPWLEPTTPFPDPSAALGTDSTAPGLLAASSSLDAKRLLQAYSKGIFPWFHEEQPVLWWSTDPRMVLRPNAFRLHKSLKKHIHNALREDWSIRFDHDFSATLARCAQTPRHGQNGTWIGPQIAVAYNDLHSRGYAHSVEVWRGERMIGGLYCVCIGKAVFGESMFALESNASKTALAALVAWCLTHSIEIIDCQQETPHLAFMGGAPIPREHFIRWLETAVSAASPPWTFDSIYWKTLGITLASA